MIGRLMHARFMPVAFIVAGLVSIAVTVPVTDRIIRGRIWERPIFLWIYAPALVGGVCLGVALTLALQRLGDSDSEIAIEVPTMGGEVEVLEL
jgi:ABC-type spermidine/putrescine transport system permease subunit II